MVVSKHVFLPFLDPLAWHGRGDQEEEYRGELALLDVSWKTVAVGSLSSLLLFPINLILVAIFRRSKVSL